MLKLIQDGVDADGMARLDGLEQGDLDVDLSGSGFAQATFGLGQHFHQAGERLDIDPGRLGFEARGFGFGNFQ